MKEIPSASDAPQRSETNETQRRDTALPSLPEIGEETITPDCEDFNTTVYDDILRAGGLLGEGDDNRDAPAVPHTAETELSADVRSRIQHYEDAAAYFEQKANEEWRLFESAKQGGEGIAAQTAHFRAAADFSAQSKSLFAKAAALLERVSARLAPEDGGYWERLRMPREDSPLGHWGGERGNSVFYPSESYIPPDVKGNAHINPDGKTVKEIFEKYGIDSIEYIDGYPNFSPVSKGQVEVDITTNRKENFKNASEQLAQQRGCSKEEVDRWMEDNHYTWHECEDGKTMQKVPSDLHLLLAHDGGVSLKKKEEQDTAD